VMEEERDAHIARYRETGTLLCLDMPAHAQFGVDWRVYTVTNAFMGVKFLPPGLHFVTYALHGDGLDLRGFFLRAEPGGVTVRRWSATDEEFLDDESIGDDERHRLTAAVHRLEADGRLGIVEEDGLKAWVALTPHVDDAVLAMAGVRLGWPLAPDGEVAQGAKGAAPVPIAPSFVTVRPRAARGEASEEAPPEDTGRAAADLTQYHLDGSERLEELLDGPFSSHAPPTGAPSPLSAPEARLLGSLEVSFVLAMLLHSLPALDHWKALVGLLCGCEAALREGRRGALFTAFVEVLVEQLEQLPPDLFSDVLLEGNFLQPTLRGLRELTADLRECPPALAVALGRLWGALKDQFGIDLEADPEALDDGETGPTVVLGVHEC